MRGHATETWVYYNYTDVYPYGYGPYGYGYPYGGGFGFGGACGVYSDRIDSFGSTGVGSRDVGDAPPVDWALGRGALSTAYTGEVT